jgi:Amt family ammonium transporter
MKTTKLFLLTLSLLLATAIPLTAATDAPAHSQSDIVWIMVCAFLVFIMQAGFMCLESGLARAKNSINVSVKNLSDFLLGSVLFWLIGYGLMFGPSFMGLIGTGGFAPGAWHDPWLAAFFVFQVMFAGTAATIDSGAVAERTRFSGYLVMSALTTALIYPAFGHWAWGGLADPANAGWLQRLGFMDFAGSTVVHSIGGWVALAGVLVVGPRLDKFDEHGRPRKIHAHSLRLAYLGTFLLFFGWFGFNAGSTLAVNDQVPGIVLNTILSACTGGLGAMLLSRIFSSEKLPSADMIANGTIGGLVAITAGCSSVSAIGAAIIGLLAGAVVAGGIRLLENVFHLDDVVGAIPVHAFCGVWGTIAVALFITPEHLVATGLSRFGLLAVQGLGCLVAFAWTFSIAWPALKILSHFDMMRVPAEHERLGLNISEHGARSSMFDLAQSLQKIVDTGTIDDSLKVDAETGTEAGEVAGHFNRLVDQLKARHQLEADDLRTETNRISGVFGRFVSERVRDRVLSGELKLGGESTQATILFCDIRNFTGLSENLKAESIVDMLNSFFNEMVHPIMQHGGTLDKFMGDSLMAVFGPPEGHDDHAARALRSAEIILRKIDAFNEVRALSDLPPIGIGIGISSGEVVAGNIGSQQRMEYTVVGDPVNTAARLEKMTKRCGATLLFSEFTLRELQNRAEFDCRKGGLLRVRGKNEPVRAYTLQCSCREEAPVCTEKVEAVS